MIYLTSLTIGGVEWISKLLYDGTEYSAEVGGNIPTATFTLQDTAASINTIAGRPEIIAYIGATKVFGGYGAVYDKRVIAPGITRLSIQCQGYAVLMDRAVTTAEHTFSGTDEAALDTLFSTYCSAISTTPVNQVAADLQDMVVPVGTSIRRAVEMIAERSGASWYVTPNKTLEYIDPPTDSASAAFWLRESVYIIYDGNLENEWYGLDATFAPSTGALVENSANAAHYMYYAHPVQTIGEKYVLSAEVKAGARTWIVLAAEAASWDPTYFDLANGVIGTSYNDEARMVALGGGWYRCMILYTADFAGDVHSVRLASADGVGSYLGDGSSGAFVRAAYFATGHPILHESMSHTVDVATIANDVTVRSGSDGTVTVDISISGGASDGKVDKEDSFNWPPTGSATPNDFSAGIKLHVGHNGSKYFRYIPLLKFDTSVIPSAATITAAELRLFIDDVISGSPTGDGIGIEYYAASNWPIDASDYTDTPSNSAYGYSNPTIVEYAWNSFLLTAPNTNINKSGETGLRLHYKYTGSPASDEIDFDFVSAEEGANSAILRVTYTSPAAQANATDATSIATYGTQKTTIVDSSVTSDAEAALIAAVELAQRKDPLEYGSLETRSDGLQIADLVHIESSSHDIDADYLIRSIRVAWPDGQLTYSIEYGDWRPDALRLMRQLAAFKDQQQ